MAEKPILAKLTSDEQITFEQAAEVDGKVGPPTFTAAPAYSGSIVSGATASPRLPHDYVIDLSGTKVAKSAKVNLDHKSNQRVGHITDFANDGTALSMTGALSAKTAFRDEVAQSASDQYPWNVSIEGALSQKELIPAGKSAVVNGRTVNGPLFVFRKAVISELAFCSRGADEGNQVTIAAMEPQEKSHMNEFEQYVASLGFEPDSVTDVQRNAFKLAFDASKASSVTPAQKSFADAAAEVAKEQKRRDSIQEMALTAMKEHPSFQEQIVTLTNSALADTNTDPRDFQLELLRGTRFNAGQFAIHANSKGNKDPRLVEAALASAVGIDIESDRSYGPQLAEAVDRNRMRNFSLQQLLMETAHANGYTCRAGERIHNGNLREVLQYCFQPVTARLAGFSSASLPGILGNVANKQILSGYMEEDTTWQEVAEIKNVSNFYTQTHYRMLDSLEYAEVGSGGLIEHGTLGEESYTTTAKTYGKMLGLTRQQIINDDLSAFNDLKTRLGRGAAKKFNNVFWAAFMNNASFFTSGLTNYISGSTTNLGLDGVGLELGVTACRQLKTPAADSQKRVGAGFRPSKLLVPPELEFISTRLYASLNINTGGSSTSTSVPDANIHAGKYRPIVQNRLSDSAFTGYSPTAWYLFGDELKPMAVSFLNGQQTPTVESTDADFDTLGILWRGYHDFGCDKSEYLAGVKSKGAA